MRKTCHSCRNPNFSLSTSNFIPYANSPFVHDQIYLLLSLYRLFKDAAAFGNIPFIQQF